jgi:hypothetical protein
LIRLPPKCRQLLTANFPVLKTQKHTQYRLPKQKLSREYLIPPNVGILPKGMVGSDAAADEVGLNAAQISLEFGYASAYDLSGRMVSIASRSPFPQEL